MITCVGLLVDLNSSLYVDGVHLTRRWEIIKRYKKFPAGLDFLAIALLVISMQYENEVFSVAAGVTLILKNLFLGGVNQIRRDTGLDSLDCSAMRALLLLANFLILVHLNSCIWMAIGCLEQRSAQESWLDQIPISEIYPSSYYLFSTSILPLGLGDLTP